jgi:thiamine transport system substrate-binding protein
MKFSRATALAVVALLTTSACSLTGESGNESETPDANGKVKQVTLVTHDSFALPKRLEKQFESSTGYRLKIQQSGDAGALTNKLVLTKDDPIGDVAFGVDNTFASRALTEGVFTDAGVTLPAGADRYALEGDTSLAPIDTASVCVNVDSAWYAEHHQTPPANFDDLVKPQYRDQLVTPGAPTSSPGFAFLLATIAAKGKGWQDYWTKLMDNGAKLTEGWEDAYYVDYTGGGGAKATRPIVVSYDSSPAFTIDKATGRSTTAALLDTCFRQVEYAGVLDHAANPEGAQAVVQWLLSPQVQKALPTSMYVFPVRNGVALPKDWARWAKQPTNTEEVPAEEIDANRDTWLTEWSDLTSR